MVVRKCDQTKCSFHVSNGGEMLCPICSDCGCDSNIVDDDCVECWNCLKDLGHVRAGIPKFLKEKLKQQITEQDKEKLKELVVEVR